MVGMREAGGKDWSRLLCCVWLCTSSSPGQRVLLGGRVPALLWLCGEWTKQLPLQTDELHGRTETRAAELVIISG